MRGRLLRARFLTIVAALLAQGRAETLCSPFSGEHDPVYYCWLVDPCIEDLIEAPRFRFAEDCSGPDCAILPSEYETCAEWRTEDGVQPCSDYGPLATCCKYKECGAEQECLDIVPGASFCRTPPSSPETVVTPSPSLREMPPHAPPPPPPPMPVSLVPVATASLVPTVPSPSAVPVDPPSPPTAPQLAPTSSMPEVEISVEPALTRSPSPVPSQPPPPASPFEEPVKESSPSPSFPVQTPSPVTVGAEPGAVAREQPSWGTAGMVVLVSGGILLALAVFLERQGEGRDGESESEDEEMALDERLWKHLLAHGGGYDTTPFVELDRDSKRHHKKPKQ